MDYWDISRLRDDYQRNELAHRRAGLHVARDLVRYTFTPEREASIRHGVRNNARTSMIHRLARLAMEELLTDRLRSMRGDFRPPRTPRPYPMPTRPPLTEPRLP